MAIVDQYELLVARCSCLLQSHSTTGELSSMTPRRIPPPLPPQTQYPPSSTAAGLTKSDASSPPRPLPWSSPPLPDRESSSQLPDVPIERPVQNNMVVSPGGKPPPSLTSRPQPLVEHTRSKSVAISRSGPAFNDYPALPIDPPSPSGPLEISPSKADETIDCQASDPEYNPQNASSKGNRKS